MNGTRITQQGIQNSLDYTLKADGEKAAKITSTKSRIAAATHIAAINPNKSYIVEDYMGHQPSTLSIAYKYYREMGGGDHLKGAYEAIKPIQEREFQMLYNDGCSGILVFEQRNVVRYNQGWLLSSFPRK